MTGTTELKKISFGAWAFATGPYANEPVPFGRVLDRLAETGYDGVEICGLAPHVTLESCRTARARTRIVRLLSDAGLGVSGYQADFSTVSPTLGGNRTPYLDLFRRYIDLCVDIGSPMLRVDTVSAPASVADSEYLSAMNRVADTWAEAAASAAANHVVMAWEFEPAFIFNRPGEVYTLHQKVNHPNFKILFDTANAYICRIAAARQHRDALVGGVPEFLKKLEGRIGAIHVMDSAADLHHNESCGHRPFEEGFIDFRVLGPQLLDVPVKWWCVDLCYWPGAWELLEASREYVLAIMGAKSAA